MTANDIAGLAKFVRAQHPLMLSAEIMEVLQRDGVYRSDGRPLTPRYIGRMVVRNVNSIRAHVATRRERLMAARKRGRHTRAEWLDMIAVFKGRCVACGRRGDPICKDHIDPLCMEGSSDGIENIQPVCRSCNSQVVLGMDR